MAPSKRNPWTQVFHPRSSAKIRLLCLPFAGGDFLPYRDWDKQISSSIEVHVLRLPGRGSRFGEPPFTRCPALLEALAQNLTDFVQEPTPFAFFGHSMGAMLSYELTRRLQGQGKPLPKKLFLSSLEAPHLKNTQRPVYHQLPEEKLIEELKDLGGIPEIILKHPDYLPIFLPTIRADLEVLETYVFEKGDLIHPSILAFKAEQDGMVEEEGVLGWKDLTGGDFSLIRYPGDHFYINDPPESFFETLNRELNSLV